MNVGDLIDIDRQLRLGQNAEHDVRQRKREEQFGQSLRELRPERNDEALLIAWKNHLDVDTEPSFGALFYTAFRWTAGILIFLGLLFGGGAAAALLRQPDAQEAINLVYFFGAIVGVQLFLLLLLPIAFIFRSRLHSDLLLVRRIINFLFRWIFVRLARFTFSPEKAAVIRSELAAVQAQSSIYKRVQPLLLLLLLQVFSFAFNLAAAAMLLFLVFFTELNFSWATTLERQAEQVHRITSVLSTPWAKIAPQAKPSLEQVVETESIDLKYATESERESSRRWWSFLLAATITYGLLPRLIAFIISAWLLKREIARSLARSSEIHALKERLRTPVVQVGNRSDVPIAAAEQPEQTQPASRKPEKTAPGPLKMERGLRFSVLFWAYDEAPPDEQVTQLLQERIGASAAVTFHAGQLDESDEAVMVKVADAKEKLELQGAAVFIEPFEPPKADLRRFLKLLRETLGESLPIVVFLAEFDGEDLQPLEEGQWELWQRSIRSFGDPLLLLDEREESS